MVTSPHHLTQKRDKQEQAAIENAAYSRSSTDLPLIQPHLAPLRLAAIDAVEDRHHLERLFRRHGGRRAIDHRLGEFDTFERMGFHLVRRQLERAVIELAGGKVGGVDFTLGPMTAPLGAIEPHLHIFAGGVMVQEPAHFEDQRRPGVKAHKGGGEIFDIHVFGHSRAAPGAKGVGAKGQRRLGHARDRHRLWVANQPERQVENVDADVDGGAAAAVLLVDKAGAHGNPTATQHPTARMVDVTQRAGADLPLHGLGSALKAEMLRRHQRLAGFVTGRNHLVNVGGCGGQRFLTDDMLAGIERGNRQLGMIHVGRADINDVEIRVVDNIRRVGAQFGDAMLLAPALQHRVHHITASHHFGMFRRRPTGHVGLSNATDADDTDFEGFAHFVSDFLFVLKKEIQRLRDCEIKL